MRSANAGVHPFIAPIRATGGFGASYRLSCSSPFPARRILKLPFILICFIIKKVKFILFFLSQRTRGHILSDATLLYNPKKPKSLSSNGLYLQYKRFVDKKQQADLKIGAKLSMEKTAYRRSTTG